VAASDSIQGAKLIGQFQPNFDTKRLQIQFREFVAPDGKHWAVAGIAMDEEESAVGVPADFSSGMGTRVLGATIGTAITTAETVATTRVLQNETGNDAILTQQLTQAATSSAQNATSNIGDEATRDLKNKKAVLSLPTGTQFKVKLRAISGGQGGLS
jgi:type IV secretory pathway VirB10-like protein